MIVRSLEDITGTDRDVVTANWRSKRILLAQDGVGFSLHETTILAGTDNAYWYAHHVEAVLVIEGSGKLIDQDNGTEYELRPGTMYLLNGHERHRLLPRTNIRAICVFVPPITGGEVHDKDGAYPLLTIRSQEEKS